jgi:hypothetical protein
VGVTPAWFFALLLGALALPVVVGLWISGPEGVQRAMVRVVVRLIELVVIAALLGLAGAALFSVVRLIRLAWGS